MLLPNTGREQYDFPKAKHIPRRSYFTSSTAEDLRVAALLVLIKGVCCVCCSHGNLKVVLCFLLKFPKVFPPKITTIFKIYVKKEIFLEYLPSKNSHFAPRSVVAIGTRVNDGKNDMRSNLWLFYDGTRQAERNLVPTVWSDTFPKITGH